MDAEFLEVKTKPPKHPLGQSDHAKMRCVGDMFHVWIVDTLLISSNAQNVYEKALHTLEGTIRI